MCVTRYDKKLILSSILRICTGSCQTTLSNFDNRLHSNLSRRSAGMESESSDSWSLRTRISNLLQKESSSDAEFLVGKPSDRYLCHKVILAAGSPVFETMFFGSFDQKFPVRVPDVTSKGFALMLQYLYSDTVTIKEESEALEAAYAAKKYMIKSLFSICEKFLMDAFFLTPESVFRIHEEASFLEMKKLQDSCLRYFSRNAKRIFLSKSFVRASKDTFQDILSLDLMNIESEGEVIEALWHWGEQQCKEKGLNCSKENVRDCTKEFLKHIRFFAMNMEELVSILEKCQILDTTDELALLWNFAMPRTRRPLAMPPNICTESRTRSISNSSKILFPGQYRYDGNMTAFLIENNQTKVEITVTGSPVTVIGVVLAFRPIPCYSCSDRSLEVEIIVANRSSAAMSSVNFKAEATECREEQQQLLLLDDYMVVEEEQVLSLTINVTAEGVRVMQCSDEVLTYDLGKSEIRLKFDQTSEGNKQLFPMKELMII